MRRREAFTLVEIAVAVFILLLLLLLAVPSLSGVLADKRLRRSLDSFNGLVHQAQEQSVSERRPYLIVWMKDALAVRPEAFTKAEAGKPIATWHLDRGDAISLTLPAALLKDAPAQWIFWPSGTCEPAVVGFTGKNGKWTARYSPLTARPDLSSYAAR
ncbi:MAG: prepilin-type N-terminal cleavage/methylation domain-containing protein [Chthoniobacterales bacterium]